jgi:membrane associated rhomboid family serine protease
MGLMGVKDDIKSAWNKQDELGKLLAAIAIATIIFWSLGRISPRVASWFVLPPDLWDFMLQPWSIVTYGFQHSGLWHLLVNVLLMYTFGRFVLNIFRPRQLYALFFMGVLIGGGLYLIVQNLFPTYVNSGGLIGASAGVYAVSLFTCTYFPETLVRLIFFDVKLKYLGIAFAVFIIAGLLSGSNMGGEIAHLGGALSGYLLATKMRDGSDYLTSFADWWSKIAKIFSFDGTQKSKRKSKMKTVHKSKSRKKSTRKTDDASDHQNRIDQILDKISDSGYDSLTKEEKDFLFKAGKN